MDDKALGPALTNRTYEFFGRKHRALLDEARRLDPHIRGAALATAVLGLLHPDLARAAQRDRYSFFSRWLHEHGGETPQIGTKERLFSLLSTEDQWMQTEDLRWVGLAVLIAVAGGALALLLKRRRSEPQDPAPASPPKPTNLHFAVAVFSGRARDAGTSTDSAGDLLTQATYWWVGRSDSWSGLAGAAGLSAIAEIPATDDALLVVVFQAPETGAGTPSSRPEGAAQLRKASRVSQLHRVGIFAAKDASQLSAAGFRR